ncbi:MAG: hypothetical protein V1489_00495 [Candidatus Liptonbacteria bacterium]
MSSKIWAWAAGIVVVVALIGWAMVRNTNVSTNNEANQSGAGTGATVTNSSTDTSNAALDKDLSNIDSQLNGLASDTANIDQSLNDQPIPQGQ